MSGEGKFFAGVTSFIVLIILLVVGAFTFFERIDNGNVGVVYSISDGVEDEVLQPGVKYVGFKKVTQYPIRLQTIKAKDVVVTTKDGKKTKLDIKYDYKVDSKQASKMYKEFGNITSEDIEKGWLRSKLQKDAKAIYEEYTLLDVISGDSSEAEVKIFEKFSNSAKEKGFLVENVTLGNLEIDEKTQASIDAIIQAGQDNEKAKLDAETEKTKADTAAYKRIKDAESQRQANEELSKSITPELIKMKEAEARLKHGWIEVQTGEAIVNAGK